MARDLALGGLLNRQAPLGRNPFSFAKDMMNRGLLYADSIGKRLLAPKKNLCTRQGVESAFHNRIQ